jgi:hypothetical protein
MTLLFLRSSNVKASHMLLSTKKLTFKGTFTFQILLQGKESPKVGNSWKNNLISNFFLFEEIHRIQSSLHCLHLSEYNTPKNASTKSTSQSCTDLTKDTFHLITPLEDIMLSTTHAFLQRAIPSNSGRAFFNGWSPHQASCQKRIWDPSPTSYLIYLEKTSHPLLICFHNPTPKGPVTSLEHHPPLRLSYFASTTTRQNTSLSAA